MGSRRYKYYPSALRHQTTAVPSLVENAMYHYQLYGLNLASCIECPTLPPATDETQIFIEYGTVPKSLQAPLDSGVLFQINREEFLFERDKVARYLVRGGTKITIERLSNDVQDLSLRLFLFGSGMAALLHQRGEFVLHGSAVVCNGRAIVFIGASGAGKSTLAAAFAQRGYSVLTEDTCVISFNAGVPHVQPGHNYIQLWADSAKALGQDMEALMPCRTRKNKRGLILQQNDATAIPLDRIYLLQPRHQSPIELQNMPKMAGLRALIENTYRPEYLAGMGRRGHNFEQCCAIADQFSLTQVSRPLDAFLLDELVERLQLDFAPASEKSALLSLPAF